MSKFHPEVEVWRPVLEQECGEIDVDFCLAWLQRESDGQVCSTGLKTPDGFNKEAGIFQLFFEHPGDVQFGTTSEQQLAACRAGRRQFHQLTDEDKRIQVRPGIAMIRKFRERALSELHDAGLTWGNQDVYRLTKMHHALPALTRAFIVKLKPSSFADYRARVTAMSFHEVEAISPAAARFMPLDRLFANSDFAGSFASANGGGGGSGSPPFDGGDGSGNGSGSSGNRTAGIFLAVMFVLAAILIADKTNVVKLVEKVVPA